MRRSPTIRRRLMALLIPSLLVVPGLLVVGSPARAEEDAQLAETIGPETDGQAAPTPGPGQTLRLDHGFQLDLPPGWVLEDADDESGDATGRRVVRLVCETAACRRTQETCTLRLRSSAVEGADDEDRLAGLYAAPLSRYFRLRAVLKSTSPGAAIRRPLGTWRFGARDWIAVETDAAPRFKSGLFAETVIDGRYLGAICKTCEMGAERHASARALLSSVRRVDRSAAR